MYTGLHVKYPLLLSDFNDLNILNRFSKYTQIPNCIKIYSVEAELIHVGGQIDTTKLSHLSQFCEHPLKKLYFTGIKLFNNFPQIINILNHNMEVFKPILKEYLLSKSFCSVQEFR